MGIWGLSVARLIPYVHSPEEDEGEQPWIIHIPVQPMPWPRRRGEAETSEDLAPPTDEELEPAPVD